MRNSYKAWSAVEPKPMTQLEKAREEIKRNTVHIDYNPKLTQWAIKMHNGQLKWVECDSCLATGIIQNGTVILKVCPDCEGRGHILAP